VPPAYASPALTPIRDVEIRSGFQTLDLDLTTGRRG
jgi:hypothetical protein